MSKLYGLFFGFVFLVSFRTVHITERALLFKHSFPLTAAATALQLCLTAQISKAGRERAAACCPWMENAAHLFCSGFITQTSPSIGSQQVVMKCR